MRIKKILDGRIF